MTQAVGKIMEIRFPFPMGFPRESHGNGNTSVQKMGRMGRVHMTLGMRMATFFQVCQNFSSVDLMRMQSGKMM